MSLWRKVTARPPSQHPARGLGGAAKAEEDGGAAGPEIYLPCLSSCQPGRTVPHSDPKARCASLTDLLIVTNRLE